MDKRTRWVWLPDGGNTSCSYIRRLGVEGTSCPLWTRCLDESVFVLRYKCYFLLFCVDNFDSAFSPHYADVDILCMTFKQEVNFGLSNPEILNFNVFQDWRQHRL